MDSHDWSFGPPREAVLIQAVTVALIETNGLVEAGSALAPSGDPKTYDRAVELESGWLTNARI